MRRKSLVYSLYRLSVDDVINLGRAVVLDMTGNTSFPTPDPSLTVVAAQIDDLEKKQTKARNRGLLEHREMMDAYNLLVETLRSLALYVEKISAGDETVMASSGFILTKDHSPSKRPDFWVQRGSRPGEFKAGCKSIRRAGAYVWQYAIGAAPPTADSGWTWAGASTQAHIYVTDLDSGSKVWVRCCAVLPEGMTPWCAPISVIVG